MLRYAAILFVLLAGTASAEDASILNPSGLPIPRFVTLKSDNINVRVGPGERYPIRWTYHRAHLPVQIVEEFAHWRKIMDYEGSTGWVQKNMLDGVRSVLVMDKPQNLYAEPEVTAAPTVRASPMVIAKLLACRPDWCRVEVSDRKAWIRKADIWGVTREETF